MSARPYGAICALTKACEVIEPRWTLPILNQLWNGYSRFSDLRRAVGNISPGILSKRLSDLEKAGLVERIEDRAKGTVDYLRTAKAIELEAAMDLLAVWAQRNIDADLALADGDLSQMMWFFSREVKSAALPSRRIVMRFHFTDEGGPFPVYWLVSEPGTSIEVCVKVPDFDVDLYVETTKLSWNAIFYGRSSVSREIDAGRLFVTGDALLERTMPQWLPQSGYAAVKGIRLLSAAD
ncbi:MAG: transcriptional regulator [Pseudomonas sp.]|nr:MAG: transcriptional regulator [Pseudomonas sp.]